MILFKRHQEPINAGNLRFSASRLAAIAAISWLCTACLGIPDNARAVEDFELERYLGTWYEVARLDHRFERGLSNVRAEYSLREDGGVKVVNSGFDEKKNTWNVAEGKAYFIDDKDVGRLKVSFFGPFYGAYNIVELDKADYRYSMVIGPNTNYLWILARDPKLDQAALDRLIDKAAALGFDVDSLIFPAHGDSMTTTGQRDTQTFLDLDLDPGPWNAVNDGVMGGVSSSEMLGTDEGLRFTGQLSLENNGGFASVRRVIRTPSTDLSAIELRIRGDGRRYQVRLRQDNNWDGVAWRQEFESSTQWQEHRFALKDFEPVFRGRLLRGYEPLDGARVRQLGLMLADGQSGAFTLDISDIRFQF